MEANDRSSPEFERVLEKFKQTLTKKNQESFKTTTLEVLRGSIADIQTRQHAQRRLQNLNRLMPFLKAIEQYGDVIQVFCKSNEIMPFIWGPAKFLLETASSSDRAFGELLSVYGHVGEALPFLFPNQEFFRTRPHKVQILSLLYEDITMFHRIALGCFQRRQWEKLFDSTWNTCKTRLLQVSSEISRRRSAIENQANPSQTEDLHESLATSGSELDTENQENYRLQKLAVWNWLMPVDPDSDQHRFTKIRANYPGTGRWLLDNQTFKEWFDPRYPTIPTLLWLTGLPGAGKTILASLVVEEVQKLTPSPRVLFFYCKHNEAEQNNFSAIARSFLLQFLRQDKGLLTYLYQKCCDSGMGVLTSRPQIEELLSFAFSGCEGAYIIIDGLDECTRDERKSITQWFRRLVESLPVSEPDRLRCLFVSQDDRVGAKDLDGIANIKIEPRDNMHDILEYSRVHADELRSKIQLSDQESGRFASNVADSAKGMFLLAELVWISLLEQISVAQVEEQLNDFPEGINKAYERIMDRIVHQAPRPMREGALQLLGWLVCAKRSLRWHEIQSLKSIDLDERSVNFARHKFAVSPKDLCGPLVETQADGTLELIHMTAKFFLVENERYIDPVAKELDLACLCIDYLNLPAFTSPPTRERVLNGDYGLMDYAVLYWNRHLEAGTSQVEGREQLMSELAGSLETFIRNHWRDPGIRLQVPDGTKKKLQYFQHLDFYDKLEQSIASSKKQLRSFGGTRQWEIPLDLVHIVRDVRSVLEELVTSDLDPSVRQTIEERYGSDLFKCPRFSCQFFTAGFSTAQDRDRHIERHTRPFRCTDEACTGSLFGFESEAERAKHVKNKHPTAASQDQEFPTDQEVAQSVQPNTIAEPASVVPTGTLELEPEDEQDLPLRKITRRSKPKEFMCPHCSKVYTKRWNFTSHLQSHSTERPFGCDICGDRFARESDLTRHEKKHGGEKRWVCTGVLKNGATWGCGKAFSRADTLKTHYKSEVGQRCRLPFLQEQEDGQEGQEQV